MPHSRSQRDSQARKLLGDTARSRTRARGFAPWNPRKSSRVLLEQVQAVLAEYDEHLPLTTRQIYYRLVAAQNLPKTDQAYKTVIDCLGRARRARVVAMDAIRDDDISTMAPNSWDSAEHFLDVVRRQAGELVLDRTAGQDARYIVLCEAAGMLPQLAKVANPYGIPVKSSGRFDSVTVKHDFAAELADHDRPTEVLHIGDHDPSGAHMYLSLAEDVQAFASELGGSVEFTRLVVTPKQIERLRLPTAPPKSTDRRAFSGQTCQCESLAPDQLARIPRDAIEARLDRRAYDRVLTRERSVRRELTRRLED